MAAHRLLRSAPSDRTLRLQDGRRLSARLWPGCGEPLVLLHGLLDCREGWEPLAASTPRPCIAFDLPGFGRSDLPSRPRISAYAEDVLAGLGQFGVDRYALVGHSLGGAVASALAERAPHEVSSLTLLAPAGFGRIRLAETVTVPGVRDLTGALLPLALSSSLALSVAYMTMVTHGRRPDKGMLARTKARAFKSVPGARDATRAVVAAGLSERAFHRRRLAYCGPVTALWGEHDRLIPPSHADGLRRALPQAQVEVWPGMGHHPQHERPERLHEFIERACSSARDAASTDRSLPRAA